jgi:hypothetical protein
MVAICEYRIAAILGDQYQHLCSGNHAHTFGLRSEKLSWSKYLPEYVWERTMSDMANTFPSSSGSSLRGLNGNELSTGLCVLYDGVFLFGGTRSRSRSLRSWKPFTKACV